MRVKTPIIIVNFKTYEEATGKKAVKLAKTCQYVSEKHGINIAVSPQFCDIFRISQCVKKILILSQHIDSIYPGSYTGHISPLSIKEAGAIGTLLNHSEKRLSLEEIEECIQKAKNYGLTTVCCSANVNESKEIAKFNPYFIAYEPPSLIGTGISVSQTKPEVVTQTVNEVKKVNPNVKVLCGAGITKGEDVKKALELGTVGVLLASGVVKAKDPKKVLIDFAESIK